MESEKNKFKLKLLSENNIRIIQRVIIIFVVIIIFLFSFYIFQNKLGEVFEEQTNVYLLEAAKKNSLALKEKFEGDLNMLKSMSLILGELDNIDMKFWIDKLSGEHLFSEFQNFGFILPDGKGYSLLFYGTDFSQTEYFRKSIAGESSITYVDKDIAQGLHSIKLMVPILKNNEVVASMGFSIYTDFYKDIIKIPSFGENSHSYLIESTGNIILHNDNNIYLHDIIEIIGNENKDKFTKIKAHIASGISGRITYLEHGKEVNMVYTPVGINDWYLLSTVQEDYINNIAAKIRTISIGFSSFASFVLAVILIYIRLNKRKHEMDLFRLAYVDELTISANKNLFLKDAGNIIKLNNSTYAMIVFDVDKFKLVNDLFGFKQGDLLIKYISDVLSKNINQNETYGHLIADRFITLMEYKDYNEFMERLDKIIEKISSYVFPDHAKFNFVVCAGVCLIDDTDKSIISLIDKAIFALEEAKKKHRTGYFIYNEVIKQKLVDESEIIKEFNNALKNHEIVVYLQPKYALINGKISGAEALVRWNHPQKGIIVPGKFISILEQNNNIVELDIYMFEEVLKKQKEWMNKGHELQVISINQSKINFFNPDYISKITSLTTKYGINPKYIELEVTESILFYDTELLVSIVKKLRNIGFKISIDDFGSGFSSLNFLKDIEVDVIKLDQQFLVEAKNKIRSQIIIENMINMCKKIGIEILAEGVETEEQVNFLCSIGCNYAQGYYFNKPMPLSQYEELMKY